MQQVIFNLKAQEQQMLYNKNMHFYIVKRKYVQIVCELPNIFTVEDAITFTLQQFQKELEVNFKAKKASDYALKISKSLGNPKMICQVLARYKCHLGLDYEQILFETGSQTFTLVCKNNLQNSDNQLQAQTSVTTTMCSQQEQQDMSIKSRVSYTNGLNKGKKPIKESDKKEKSGGFCFFNKCF